MKNDTRAPRSRPLARAPRLLAGAVLSVIAATALTIALIAATAVPVAAHSRCSSFTDEFGNTQCVPISHGHPKPKPPKDKGKIIDAPADNNDGNRGNDNGDVVDTLVPGQGPNGGQFKDRGGNGGNGGNEKKEIPIIRQQEIIQVQVQEIIQIQVIQIQQIIQQVQQIIQSVQIQQVQQIIQQIQVQQQIQQVQQQVQVQQVQQQQQVQQPPPPPPVPSAPANALSALVCDTSVTPARYGFTVNPSITDTSSATYSDNANSIDIQTRQQWRWDNEADTAYRPIAPTANRSYSIDAASGRTPVVRVQSRARARGRTAWGQWGNARAANAWYVNSTAPGCAAELPPPIVAACRSAFGVEASWALPSGAWLTGDGFQMSVHGLDRHGQVTSLLSQYGYNQSNTLP